LNEVNQFIAYGSITLKDMARRQGESEWRTVEAQLQTVIDEQSKHPTEVGAFGLLPRRQARSFDDYGTVPHHQRAGTIIVWIILGCTIYPPCLWKASLSVISNRIFSRQHDEKGQLRPWPRSIETWMILLLLMHVMLLFKLVGAFFVWVYPAAEDITKAFSEGMRSARAIF
jgi:hypothetical protein